MHPVLCCGHVCVVSQRVVRSDALQLPGGTPGTLRCAARFVHTRRLPWACCAGLKQYGWLQHDGESYGLQQLHDEEYNITTAWVSCSLAGRRTFGKYASRGRAAGSLRVF